MRATCFTLVAMLALAACTQEPDYVLSADLGLEGGDAGDGSGALPDGCDPQLTRAVLLFSRVEVGCTYDLENEELHRLLIEIIYMMKPEPELTPAEAETYPPDAICSITRLPWHFAIEGDDIMKEDFSTAVICPRYCKAVRLWLEEHRDLALECLPDANP